MNNSRQLLPLAGLCQRQFARHASSDAVGAKMNKLKEMQKHFNIPDDTPVHIKKGFGDRALLGLTTALIAVGLGMSAEVCWKLTFKDA